MRKEVVLTFTGDVMIGRLVNQYLKKTNKPGNVWGDTLKILKRSDGLMINLEAALTENEKRGKKQSPVFFFRSQPENVAVLETAGVDHASLANNHSLDFGKQGLIETLETLKAARIKYSGAGRNERKARKPAGLKIKDLKIKIFSFTDNEPGWEAKGDKAGTNYMPINLNDQRVESLLDQIKRFKDQGFFIIVSAHWGPNMIPFPPQKHIEFARSLIDQGVDVFHGHSSHVFQPVEAYKGKVIMYDCGEMIDDYAVDPKLRNDQSFIFQAVVKEEQIRKLMLYPIQIEIKPSREISTRLLTGSEAREVNQRMKEKSSKLGTEFATEKDRLRLDLE